jgi:hypothetical protein
MMRANGRRRAASSEPRPEYPARGRWNEYEYRRRRRFDDVKGAALDRNKLARWRMAPFNPTRMKFGEESERCKGGQKNDRAPNSDHRS